MRTRCPECGTIFRVTSEQLRRKAGKVRCGHCQAVFNAFDHWQADTGEPDAGVPAAVADTQPAVGTIVPAPDRLPAEAPATVAALDDQPVRQTEPWTEAEAASAPPADEPEDWVPESEASDEAEAAHLFEPSVAVGHETDGEPVGDVAAARAIEAASAAASEPAIASPEEAPEQSPETPEESTLAARQAGLVAARELIETAAYNRWAAGTLAGDGLHAFAGEPARRAAWPFVLVSVVLLLALLGQLLYHFRTEVVLRFPDAAALYRLVAVDIPLPRNPAQVSIETSDLQSDNARGLFILQATLKNRAAYAQAWPALELSLTDTNDTVVSRRVMYAAEYLPPGTAADAFPANGEIAVKLWIEARSIGASGYRLYLFYP